LSPLTAVGSENDRLWQIHRSAMRGDDVPIIVSVDPHIGKYVASAAIFVTELTLLILIVSNNCRVPEDAHLDVVEFHFLDGIKSGLDIGNCLLFGIWLTIGTYSTEIISHQAVESIDVLDNDRAYPSLFQKTNELCIC